jgi:hypothetical protein
MGCRMQSVQCTVYRSRFWIPRLGMCIMGCRQSARLPYLSWKIEIRRDWYRSQNGRDLGAKVKMCTPVHGLSGFSAIDQT